VLDIESELPWFYPFKDYDFPDAQFDFWYYFTSYWRWDGIGIELLTAAGAGLIAVLTVWLYRRIQRRRSSQKH